MTTRGARGRRAKPLARTAAGEEAALEQARAAWERSFPESDGEAFALWVKVDLLRDRFSRLVDRTLSAHGLVYSEYRVLSVLRLREDRQGLTPAGLRRAAGMTAAGMTRTLGRLDDAGYTQRTPNPDDGRSILVTLTPEGWDFAEQVCRAMSETHEQLFGGLSKRRYQETMRVVDELMTLVPGDPPD